MRMDYGLGNVIKAMDMPLLGNRVSTHNTNLSIQCDEEEVQRAQHENVVYNSNDTSMRIVTLAKSNEASKLELSRTFEPLDKSKPSQNCEGISSQCVFSYGDG